MANIGMKRCRNSQYKCISKQRERERPQNQFNKILGHIHVTYKTHYLPAFGALTHKYTQMN